MAVAVTSAKQVPDDFKALLPVIEYFGLPWRFVHSYHVIEEVRNNRFQVRDIAQVAPPSEVARYADAYRRGEVLPAIVVTKDGFLVDGATRNEGAKKAGYTTLPAFVIQVNLADSPPMVRKNLKKLAFRLNNTHGRSMTRANVAGLIDSMTEGETSPEAFAADLNCSAALVRSIMAARKSRDRLEERGISTEGLTQSHLAALGGHAFNFNDPVYDKLADVVRDCAINTSETGQLVRKLGYVTNDPDKLKLLDEELATRDVDVHGRPSRAGKMRRTLGQLLPFQDVPHAAVEGRMDKALQHRKMLLEARAVIDKVLLEQEDVIAKLTVQDDAGR